MDTSNIAQRFVEVHRGVEGAGIKKTSAYVVFCAESCNWTRIAGRPAGPCQKMRDLKAWVGQEANPPLRFRVRTRPFYRGSFNLLVRLVLGELPVGRTRALYGQPAIPRPQVPGGSGCTDGLRIQ